jgi:hypothetical protein
VVGGFAIRGAGYGRETMDLDLVVATDPANEAKVYKALESLPDKAVLALDPGEIAKYTVIRVGDEICVDLMASASGIGYEEAAQDQIIRVVDSVLEKLLGARVGQLRSPVGKPALLDALFADFKDIARTSRAIAIEEPGFSSAAYRFPANYTEAAATTHADSLLTLLEGDAVLIAKFIAFEMPADFVADLRADRDALDGSNSGKHSDNFDCQS